MAYLLIWARPFEFSMLPSGLDARCMSHWGEHTSSLHMHSNVSSMHEFAGRVCCLCSSHIDMLSGVHSFFLKWLSSFLVGSLYPGSPFPRKVFAASLLYGLVLAWQHDGEWTASREVKAQRTTILSPSKLNLSIGNLQVFDESFASRQGISALLGKVRPLGKSTGQTICILGGSTKLGFETLKSSLSTSCALLSITFTQLSLL